MGFTLANGVGLVSAFSILALIFLVCCCQTEKDCLQVSGDRDSLAGDSLAGENSIMINTNNHRSAAEAAV